MRSLCQLLNVLLLCSSAVSFATDQSDETRAARVGAALSLQLGTGSSQIDPGQEVAKGTPKLNLFDDRILPLTTNPYRTYPPSCLSEPLPRAPIGPFDKWIHADLAARDARTGSLMRERVLIVVWRIECSDSVRPRSASLLGIFRTDEYGTDPDTFILFPDIRISQGTLSFDDANNGQNWLRIAELPNTKALQTLVDTPIMRSTTYVLESPPPEVGGLVDLNQPFRLRIDNLFDSDNRYEIEVPGYVQDPIYRPYPLGMPITSYLSGNWYDADASGEGLSLHVFDSPDDLFISRVSYIWATFDLRGNPYWLYGEGAYQRFDFGVETELAYRVGGSFAGAGYRPGPLVPWGTASVKFLDCNHLELTYVADPALPESVPHGSGRRTLTRLANPAGLPCE